SQATRRSGCRCASRPAWKARTSCRRRRSSVVSFRQPMQVCATLGSDSPSPKPGATACPRMHGCSSMAKRPQPRAGRSAWSCCSWALPGSAYTVCTSCCDQYATAETRAGLERRGSPRKIGADRHTLYARSEDAMKRGMALTYAQAGVSIDAGNELVEAIKPLARATRTEHVIDDVGGFAGLCRIPPGI